MYFLVLNFDIFAASKTETDRYWKSKSKQKTQKFFSLKFIWQTYKNTFTLSSLKEDQMFSDFY
jgi:hypothetical protein